MRTLTQPLAAIDKELNADQLFSKLTDLLKGNELDFDLIADQLRNLPEAFLRNTILGHALLKPFGYAGDFLLIDKLYAKYNNSVEKYGKWDSLIHSLHATRAVRNRKSYFINLMRQKLFTGERISLLNLASGPSRDLQEVYNGLEKPDQLLSTCIDMDENAISYAKILNHDYLDHIAFINKNVFRFNAVSKYDVIWSAGLFDYFNDKAFLLLLNRLKTWLNPGGEIIIGNFNADYNPSREFMERLTEWNLNHRTAGELVAVATKAGFDLSAIRVGAEPLNVNLFLHLKNVSNDV